MFNQMKPDRLTVGVIISRTIYVALERLAKYGLTNRGIYKDLSLVYDKSQFKSYDEDESDFMFDRSTYEAFRENTYINEHLIYTEMLFIIMLLNAISGKMSVDY